MDLFEEVSERRCGEDLRGVGDPSPERVDLSLSPGDGFEAEGRQPTRAQGNAGGAEEQCDKKRTAENPGPFDNFERGVGESQKEERLFRRVAPFGCLQAATRNQSGTATGKQKPEPVFHSIG